MDPHVAGRLESVGRRRRQACAEHVPERPGAIAPDSPESNTLTIRVSVLQASHHIPQRHVLVVYGAEELEIQPGAKSLPIPEAEAEHDHQDQIGVGDTDAEDLPQRLVRIPGQREEQSDQRQQQKELQHPFREQVLPASMPPPTPTRLYRSTSVT
jgi:hypothetical protein